LRDRTKTSLCWRYEDHPVKNYSIIKFLKHNLFIGYIIYIIENENTCIVCDIITRNEDDICPILSLFLKYLLENKMITIVRIPMNDNNYYADSLRMSGFMRRKDKNIIQVFTTPSYLRKLNVYRWFNTAGDKDT
jgi:hypothetical protein